MGLLMRNGIEYSGGGGSESGGGNVYGFAIDESRKLFEGTITNFTQTLEYIATEDAIAFVDYNGSSGTNQWFSINNVVIPLQVTTGHRENYSVPIRKGDKISARHSSDNEGCYFHLICYGLKQGTNGIFAPVIYSDNERVIGVWRDNKPLYQKTVDIAQYSVSLVNSEWRNIFTISDLDYLVSAIVHVQSPNVAQLLRFNASGSYIQGASAISINLTDYGSLPVTFQYTKTTDVAGSGSWNTDGIPTHHYSTNEQVIGTWVDGKPLYEKCFTYSSASFSNQQMTLANDLSNVDYVVNYGGCAKEPRDNRNVPLPYLRKALNECLLLQIMQLPGGTVSTAICTNDSWYTSLENIKIWVQYTKTTD